MAFPFVATKTFLPVRPRAWIDRPRLIAKLEQGFEPGRNLILVSAPPGYGKTTLVSELCAEKLSGSTPECYKISWLSLESTDNDLIRLLVYLVNAFQKAFPGSCDWMLAALQSQQPPSNEIILADLINELSTRSERWILVLDDYHSIHVERIHDAVTFLLDHMPEQMRLILLTRTDPPLPLARLRARQQMVELRADDLRFTVDETQAFLSQVMSLKLSPEDIASLDERIEGWAAGLQLAALALQGSLSIEGRKDASTFIREFSGSDYYILDFLTEEVLDRLDETTKQFLLQTCVLSQICGSLCDALTGRSDSHAMLERLSKANLFIVPLDNQHHWYRYHHLFAELLLSRLQYQMPEQILGLYNRASVWCAQHELMDEAILYALAAKNDEEAARLIMGYAPQMISQGRIAGLTTWISKLPDNIVMKYPVIGLALVWAFYFEYKFDQAEAYLNQVEQALTPDDKERFAGEILLWKGVFARAHEQLEQGILFLRESIAALPAENLALLGRAYLFLGLIYSEIDCIQSQQAFLQSRSYFEAGEYIHGTLVATRFLVSALIDQGLLRQAQAFSRQALQLAGKIEKWPTANYAYTGIGVVLYEQNDLGNAAFYLNKGIGLAETGGNTDILFGTIFRLARVNRAQGEWEKAQQLLDRARSIAQPAKMLLHAQIDDEQVLLWLAQNRLAEAKQIAENGYPPASHVPKYPALIKKITWARAAIALHQPKPALCLLVSILETAEKAGMRRLVWQILLLQALAWIALNQEDRADPLLTQALTQGSQEGLLRLFLDEGEPARKVLIAYRARHAGGSSLASFINQVIASFPESNPSTISLPAQPGLVEPLSAREIEVLRLIATGCSNKEIADHLVIAISTVKQHLNHILGKLEAANRTQAVAKARALGLLES